jgi:hypothetical protein
MTDLTLRIDHVVVELADASRRGSVEPALRRAMELLAHKLLGAGVLPGPVDLGSTFDALGPNTVSTEVLLSPDGPERLAVALFEQVKRRVLTRARNEGASP